MYVKDSLLMAGLVLMIRSRYGYLIKLLSGLVLWNLYDLIHQVGESDCLETIQFVFKTNHVSARQLARCTGELISMKAVCRNLDWCLCSYICCLRVDVIWMNHLRQLKVTNVYRNLRSDFSIWGVEINSNLALINQHTRLHAIFRRMEIREDMFYCEL